MNEPTVTGRTITDRITGLADAAARTRRGTPNPHTSAVIAADELIAALGLLTLPAAHLDERLATVRS